MKTQQVEFPFDARIEISKGVYVINTAISLGLRLEELDAETRSSVYLIGEKSLGLKKFFFPPQEKMLGYNTILKRAHDYSAANWSVAQHFLDNPKENIPDEWISYDLAFGDIFIGEKDGKKYLLSINCHEVIDEWKVYFKLINSYTVPDESARFVCYAG